MEIIIPSNFIKLLDLIFHLKEYVTWQIESFIIYGDVNGLNGYWMNKPTHMYKNLYPSAA